jgi:transcriptional regulator with XRE-family HTH domain
MSHLVLSPVGSTALAEFMRQRHISGAEIAAQLGVGRQSVYYWTSGRRSPRPESRRRIAQACAAVLGEPVTATDLWGDGTRPPGPRSPQEVTQ